MLFFKFDLNYFVINYQQNVPAINTIFRLNTKSYRKYTMPWFCIQPEDGFYRRNMSLMINYKGVYRLDLYLFYLPVYLKHSRMPCQKIKKSHHSNIFLLMSSLFFLDFKLLPCSLCSMFSFGYFPSIWVLKADISEPSIGSIFIGIFTCLWRWNR